MREILVTLTRIVSMISQFLAIFVILVGIFKALWIFVRDLFTAAKSLESISESKMEIGHAFSLGLAFLIGASILQSVLAPTWDDIGKLTAIIGIRTLLNYFLVKELQVHGKRLKENRKIEKKD
jgi:uncharacterized membrane protein